MNWDKIDLQAILSFIKETRKDLLPSLDNDWTSVIYSDDKEEIRISYREVLK